MKLNSITLTVLSTLFISSIAIGQNGSNVIEEGYYIYPVSPGKTNTLAGTMGELRSSHFHSGIDVRTGGQQGAPVVAVADGYISRVAVSPGGYGNALYLNHPNGTISVYAHLKSFEPELQEYARSAQYKNKSFAVNLFPERNQFTFSQGDTIALSGNSGSSGGPHLHFDIRDQNHKVLNPLKYGFNEIIDTRAPEAKRMILKTMNINSRVNGQFGKVDIPLQRSGRHFTTAAPIKAFGSIGVELYAYDRQDYTNFRTGINRITMTIDGYLAFEQNIETWAFSEGRNFYAHIDYETLRKTSRRYHKLHVSDGNKLKFYKTNYDNGLLTFTEECEHDIEIVMEDSYGNTSKVFFQILCEKPLENIELSSNKYAGDPGFEVMGNTLLIYANHPPEEMEANASIFSNGEISSVPPAYFINKETSVYLWDLRKSIPDSLELCSSKLKLPINASIPSNTGYTYYDPYVDVSFNPNTLFDTAYVSIDYELDTANQQEIFKIGDDRYPFNKSMNITLKPALIDSYDLEKARVFRKINQKSYAYIGGKWEGEKIKFSSRIFGNYVILHDSVPPRVRALIVNSDQLVFRINDGLSGIKKYELKVDDEWVLMNYDPKIRRIWSEKRDPTKPFKGKVVLTVTDLSDNETVYETKIN